MIVIFNARGPNHNLIVVGPPNKSPPLTTDPSLETAELKLNLRVIVHLVYCHGSWKRIEFLFQTMRITSSCIGSIINSRILKFWSWYSSIPDQSIPPYRPLLHPHIVMITSLYLPTARPAATSVVRMLDSLQERDRERRHPSVRPFAHLSAVSLPLSSLYLISAA